MQTYPVASGLYDPRFEHDSCGVSFVAHMRGVASNELVRTGLSALCNLEHRGATGAEADTGDGAGILIQIPDRLLRDVVDFELPPVGRYAVGIAFLPVDEDLRDKAQDMIETIVVDCGLTVLGWRDVPIRPDCLGKTARAAMPAFRQLFVSSPSGASGIALDRLTFVARKRIEHELPPELRSYFSSLSARTLVYKGMFTPPQLGEFYPDLTDPRIESALLLVHSRFSTNTFPSWPLAHPYRYIAHNGEINTVQGNQNWMRAREAMAASPRLPDLDKAFPICTEGASDTARFDEVLELLHLAGRPLHHAVLMMIPEAWENNSEMDPDRRAFYQFHASVMEPWDGPASVTFTDGTVIGAVLDRNGLRPSRYWVTDDDLVIMASEVGVLDVDPAKVVSKGRLQPGRMFLIDTREGRIVDDEEIKKTLAAEHPYGEWLRDGMVQLPDLPAREHVVFSHDSVLRRQQMFGYTHEELKIIVAPMAKAGVEPIGSMGTDTPIAALSNRPRLLVRLLPAAVRAGHQPAARRHPRGGRDGGVVDDRAGVERARARTRQLPPARAAVPDPRQRRAGADHPRQRRRPVPGLRGARREGPVPRGRRRGRAARRARTDQHRGVVGDRARRPRDRALRSQRRLGRRADPVAAAHRGGAPPPRAHQAAHQGRDGGRVRRRPRGAPHGAAGRLRRRCDQPLPRVRIDRGPDRRGHARPRRDRPAQGGQELHQGVRQGRAQGDVEDGRVDGGVVHRRPDLRGDRARRGARRPLLHRHRQPDRRDRPRRDRRRRRRPPCDRQPAAARGAGAPQARAGRRVPVAARGRVPPVQPRDRVQAAARHPRQALRHLQGVQQQGRRPVAQPGDAARPVHVPGPDRSGAVRSTSTTSSRSRRSCAASRPVPCRTGRSRPRRTRRWRSR